MCRAGAVSHPQACFKMPIGGGGLATLSVSETAHGMADTINRARHQLPQLTQAQPTTTRMRCVRPSLAGGITGWARSLPSSVTLTFPFCVPAGLVIAIS